ncbi:hypothetical protein Tco_0450255 [Tanacetum coccineum]
MNQNFYNSDSSGFDQFQPPQYSDVHQPPEEISIEELKTMMKSYCEIISQQREQEAILLQEQAANPFEPSPVLYFYNADFLEDMDAYRDDGIGNVIFGELFLREVGIKTKWFKGIITLYNGDDERLEKEISTKLVECIFSGILCACDYSVLDSDAFSHTILAHNANMEESNRCKISEIQTRQRTLGDYSRPSNEGYQNTIELPEESNVSHLQSDTIQLVQNRCGFHGLRSEDPIHHLKDFLKIIDSIDLNGDTRNTTHLRFFPLGRTAKLRNDILRFQQRQDESLYNVWNRFNDLLLKVPHHGLDLWLQVQIFYDHVDSATQMAIDYAAGGRLRKLRAEVAWVTIEDLAQYEDEEWDDPIFLEKGSLDYINATLEQELESMNCQVESLMGLSMKPSF